MVTDSKRSRLFATISLAAIVAFFWLLLAGYHVDSYQGVDENGYILTAKRLAVTGDAAKRTADPYEFVSGNWVQMDENLYYAKYPLGYPWLCAAAYRLGGPSAVFWVNPILAILSIIGIFLLGRAVAGDFAGALAAILLATNPMHAYFGLSALSHSGSICCAIWAVFFAWRWTQSGGWASAILTGAFVAYAISVRYTEALLALPVLGLVAWRCIESPRETRSQLVGQLVSMVAAALLVLTPLLIHHWKAFGAPWITGYALCGESTGFGWQWFGKNWALMLTRLDQAGLFLLSPIGLAGLLFLVAHDRKRALCLGLWAVPGLLVYTAYYWAPEGEGPWYIRFFVSVFPPLILSGLFFLAWPGRRYRLWNLGLGAFVLLVTVTNLRETTRQLQRQMMQLVFAKQTGEILREKLPNDAVILSGNYLCNYLEFVGDYTLYAQETFVRGSVTNLTKVLRDDDPHPFHRAKAQRIERLLGDKRDPQLAELQRELLTKHLAAGRTVALVMQRDEFRRWRGRAGEKLMATPVTEWMATQRWRDDETRFVPWTLYTLKIRDKSLRLSETAAWEEKVDQLQFRAKSLRDEFDEKYPGGRQAWQNIMDVERELREYQDRLKKRQPAPKPPGTPVTNAPPGAAGKELSR